jgi:DNA modification methylase
MSDIKSKNITMVDVDSIVPNPKNANRHSIEQIKRLEKLIKYQGFRNPLIVSNRTGFLVVGHGRLEAAKNIGMQEVPVIYQDFENEAQEYAYLISDNEIARWAELDKQSLYDSLKEIEIDDIELLGLEEFEIPEIDVLEPQTDEDEVPEVEHPITRRGDIWLLGKHRLMCGDSTMIDDVEKLMNGEKADMVFTSPPYSDMRDYNGGKDLSVSNISEFITTFFIYTKTFVVNLGIQRKDGEIFEYWNEYIKKARDNGLKFSSWNVWNREGMGGSIGNMTAMFPIEHEWIFVFSDGKLELNKTKQNLSSKSKKMVSNRMKNGSTEKKIVSVNSMGKIGTVSSFDFDRYVGEERSHPAQFPVALAESYIEACSNETVIDPFSGGGTTIIASEKVARKCYGMELDEKYCDVIINRWQNYTGKKATLELTGQTYEELKQERENA